MRTPKLSVALVAVAMLCFALAHAETLSLSTMGGQQLNGQALAGNTYTYSDFDQVTHKNEVVRTTFTDCTVSNGDLTIAGRADIAFSAEIYMSSLDFTHLSVSGGRVVLSNYFPYSTSIVFSQVTGTARAGASLFDMGGFLPQGNVSIVVRDSAVSWSAASSGSVVLLGSQVSTKSAVFVLNVEATNAASIVEVAGTTVSTQSVLAVDYCTCNSCSTGVVSLRSLTTVKDSSLLRITHPDVSGSSVSILAGESLDISGNSLALIDNVKQPNAALSSGTTVTKDSTSTVTLRNINVKSIGGTFSGPAVQNVVAGGSGASGSSAFTTPTVLDSSGKSGGQCYPAVCIPGNYNRLSADCSCGCGSFNDRSCTTMVDPLSSFGGQCGVDFCILCSADGSTCTLCKNGYTVVNGKCQLVGKCTVPRCAQCMLNDSSKCSTCMNGYVLTAKYTCVSRHVADTTAAAPYSLCLTVALMVLSVITYIV